MFRHPGLAVLCLIVLAAAAGANWPRFRGPDGSGLAEPEKNLPVRWSDSQNILWKTALPGRGSSSPITWGDQVFLTCFSGFAQDARGDSGNLQDLSRQLICINRQDGAVTWRREVKPSGREDTERRLISEHGYASSTPVTDGERVYAFFGKTGLLAFDLEGNQLWQTSLGEGSALNNWGSAASPVLHQNLVIVNANAEGEVFAALDKRTGQEVWRAKAGGAYGSWCTPILAESAAGQLELLFNVPFEVWSLNPDTGKLLWYAEATDGPPTCPSLVAEDGVAYALGGRSGGCTAIRLGGKGDVTQSHVLWKTAANSYVPSPVAVGGHLYFINGDGIAYCLDLKTGQQAYAERLEGASGRNSVYASIVAADGKIYGVTRTQGAFVLAAKPEFELLAHNVIASDASDFNASPVPSDGRLLLRSDQYLYCIGDK